MKKKENKQIFIIHGGMTFKNRMDYFRYLKKRNVSVEKKISWSGEYLDKKCGKYFTIVRPRMPLQDFAKYKEWKIHFERFFPLFKNGVVLIGSSLGSIFLIKYLSENKFPKKISGIFLVCPPFDNTVAGEDLVGGFKLKSDLSFLEKNSKNLHLFFSEDDDVVPLSHADKYKLKIPNASFHIYKSKNGHFKVTIFPELIRLVNNCR